MMDCFGDELVRCSMTGYLHHFENTILFGGYIKGYKLNSVVGKSAESQLRLKINRQLFDENDANCNTCKYMQRVKHEKDRHGFLCVQCTNPNGLSSSGQYRKETPDAKVFWIHPDDWMGMECYQHRSVIDANEDYFSYPIKFKAEWFGDNVLYDQHHH